MRTYPFDINWELPDSWICVLRVRWVSLTELIENGYASVKLVPQRLQQQKECLANARVRVRVDYLGQRLHYLDLLLACFAV